MSPTAVVLVVLTAAAFPLLLWAIGRTVTANAAGEPATTVTWRARNRALRISHHLTTANRPGSTVAPHQRRR
jgi:hypothetical protein